MINRVFSMLALFVGLVISMSSIRIKPLVLSTNAIIYPATIQNLEHTESNPANQPTTGTTTLVSIASNGTQGNGESLWPFIPADGRYIAFHSLASNLVSNDFNSYQDIFVHDQMTGQITLVSIASDDTQGNGHSRWPAMSADGRFVTFTSDANNLVANDTNNWNDIFVHDRDVDADGIFDEPGAISTTRVSVASDGTEGNSGSDWSFISADGRYVSFSSYASNLVSNDTNGMTDVFVHDRFIGETSLVSIAFDGTQANGESGWAFISTDGRFITFHSSANNLVIGDTNYEGDIFVYDQITDQTTLVSIASDGTQGNGKPVWWTVPSISETGRYVAFASTATNLVNGDTNQADDIFVHDRDHITRHLRLQNKWPG